jgi:hypothetical protein
MVLSKSQRAKVERALGQHYRFRNSYFWEAPARSFDRRYLEKQNNWSVSFCNRGREFKYISYVQASARNIYYTGKFYLDGELRNVSLFEGLV